MDTKVKELVEKLEKLTGAKVNLKERVDRSTKKRFYAATSGTDAYTKRVQAFMKTLVAEHPEMIGEQREFENIVEQIEVVFMNIEMYLNGESDLEEKNNKQTGTPFHTIQQ